MVLLNEWKKLQNWSISRIDIRIPPAVVELSFLSQKTVRAMLNKLINTINLSSVRDIVMKMGSTATNVMILYILVRSFAF